VCASPAGALPAGLAHSLSGGVSGLAGGLSALGGRAAHLPHDVVEALHHGFEHVQSGLGDNWHELRSGLEAALKGALGDGLLQYPAPRWPLYAFMACACGCLGTSAVCHLLSCCSLDTAGVLWRLDYSGIVLLIVASFFPPVYYGFLCAPFWRHFYMGVTFLLGTTTLGLSLLPAMQRPTMIKVDPARGPTSRVRAVMFSALGLWGAIPICHQLLVNGHVWHVRTALSLDLLMGATYLIGATIYALRIPERWYPGRFDVWLHSHQIFHVAVVLGAYIHYKAVVLLVQWRDASGGCAMPMHGSLADALADARALGHEALQGADGVWRALAHNLAVHIGLGGAGGATA